MPAQKPKSKKDEHGTAAKPIRIPLPFEEVIDDLMKIPPPPKTKKKPAKKK